MQRISKKCVVPRVVTFILFIILTVARSSSFTRQQVPYMRMTFTRLHTCFKSGQFRRIGLCFLKAKQQHHVIPAEHNIPLKTQIKSVKWFICSHTKLHKLLIPKWKVWRTILTSASKWVRKASTWKWDRLLEERLFEMLAEAPKINPSPIQAE